MLRMLLLLRESFLSSRYAINEGASHSNETPLHFLRKRPRLTTETNGQILKSMPPKFNFGMTKKIIDINNESEFIAAELKLNATIFPEYDLSLGLSESDVYVQTGTSLIYYQKSTKEATIYRNINPISVSAGCVILYKPMSEQDDLSVMKRLKDNKIGHGKLKKYYEINFANKIVEVKDVYDKPRLYEIYVNPTAKVKSYRLNHFRTDKFEDGYIGHYKLHMFYYIVIDKFEQGYTNDMKLEDYHRNTLNVLRCHLNIWPTIIPDFTRIQEAFEYYKDSPSVSQFIPIALWILEISFFDDFSCGLQDRTARESLYISLRDIYFRGVASSMFIKNSFIWMFDAFFKSLPTLSTAMQTEINEQSSKLTKDEKAVLQNIVELIRKNQTPKDWIGPGIMYNIFIELHSAILNLFTPYRVTSYSHSIFNILLGCIEKCNNAILESYVCDSEVLQPKYDAIVYNLNLGDANMSNNFYQSLPYFSRQESVNHRFLHLIKKLDDIMYKCQMYNRVLSAHALDLKLWKEHIEQLAQNMKIVRNYNLDKNIKDRRIKVTQKYYICLQFTILNDCMSQFDPCHTLKTECDKFLATEVWDFDDARCMEYFGAICDGTTEAYGLSCILGYLRNFLLQKTGPYLTDDFFGWYDVFRSLRSKVAVRKGTNAIKMR